MILRASLSYFWEFDGLRVQIAEEKPLVAQGMGITWKVALRLLLPPEYAVDDGLG